jgi:hypothetical protein
VLGDEEMDLRLRSCCLCGALAADLPRLSVSPLALERSFSLSSLGLGRTHVCPHSGLENGFSGSSSESLLFALALAALAAARVTPVPGVFCAARGLLWAGGLVCLFPSAASRFRAGLPLPEEELAWRFPLDAGRSRFRGGSGRMGVSFLVDWSRGSADWARAATAAYVGGRAGVADLLRDEDRLGEDEEESDFVLLARERAREILPCPDRWGDRYAPEIGPTRSLAIDCARSLADSVRLLRSERAAEMARTLDWARASPTERPRTLDRARSSPIERLRIAAAPADCDLPKMALRRSMEAVLILTYLTTAPVNWAYGSRRVPKA